MRTIILHRRERRAARAILGVPGSTAVHVLYTTLAQGPGLVLYRPEEGGWVETYLAALRVGEVQS